MRRGLHDFFMWRSRHLDAWLLAIAPALLVLFAPVGGTIAIAFLVIGIWLVFGRHKSIRYFDNRLAMACFALAGYSFARQLIDQNFVLFGPASCRNYYLLLLALPFIPVGIVLVRNPVVALAYGARLVLGLLVPVSLFWLATERYRLSFESNPLIVSYIIALLASVARFPVRTGDRTGIIWFYLAIVPLAATGGRIGLLFYPLAMLIDLFKAPEIRQVSGRMRLVIVAALTVVLLSTSISTVVKLRVNQTVGEFKTVILGEEGQQPLRFSIWEAAADAFVSNPLFGAGHCTAQSIMTQSLRADGIPFKFQHFHNMFADFLAYIGLVGLALFGWVAYEIWLALRSARDIPDYQVPIVILLSMILFYGMTGSAISDDRMTAATLLVIGSLIKQGMLSQNRQRRGFSTS